MTRRERLERERHIRAVCFVAVSLCLSMVGYFWISFDRWQTLGYGVMAYCILILMNFRCMYERYGQAVEE